MVITVPVLGQDQFEEVVVSELKIDFGLVSFEVLICLHHSEQQDLLGIQANHSAHRHAREIMLRFQNYLCCCQGYTGHTKNRMQEE